MDVVSTNTVSRLAVKTPDYFSPLYLNYTFFNNFLNTIWQTTFFSSQSSAPNDLAHSGYILFFGSSDTNSSPADGLQLQDGL